MSGAAPATPRSAARRAGPSKSSASTAYAGPAPAPRSGATPARPTAALAAPSPSVKRTPSSNEKGKGKANGQVVQHGVGGGAGARRIGVDWLGQDPPNMEHDDRAVVWLDIDNTLYKKSTRIAEMMGERIRAYFTSMGLSDSEAEQLHKRYYREYGLAIRGLVKHHQIDPLDYDRRCDRSLPLEEVLSPDPRVQRLFADLDRTKCRVFALTNAYKYHAHRVLHLLGLHAFVEGIVYCDYEQEDFACKPEPAYYLQAMEAIGLRDPSRCYFVDDSRLNIRAAKELGWGSCVLFDEIAEQPTNAGAGESFAASVLLPGGAQSNGHASVAAETSAQAPPPAGAHSNGAGIRIPSSAADFDRAAIQRDFQQLPHALRTRLFETLLEACLPSDLVALSQMLERFVRGGGRDLVGGLPDAVGLRILEKLSLKDLLTCRLVSRRWRDRIRNPALWRSHALALTEGDPVPVRAPENEDEWEQLVKGLYLRERNWSKGLAQSIDLFEGHTGFVTSIKLKGTDTLVTGSYDETIRVWHLPTRRCLKVLTAKAISCLDFLLDEQILCAGLYDTGRVMMWDMRTWEPLHTLSGHNKGIRSVALSKNYLVSVGQDKAIVVWDWKSGSKIVRFGQQSNVSLGVFIVDTDKIVALTVDGVIRTFSITLAKMIGQFDLHKLGAAVKDEALAAKVAGLGGSSATMLQWFAASGNTVTIATKDRVVHLQWKEHLVTSTPSVRPSAGVPESPRPGKASRASNASSSSAGSTASAAQRSPTFALPSPPSQSPTRRFASPSPSAVASPRAPLTAAASSASLLDVPNGASSDAAAAPSATGTPTTRYAPNLAAAPRIIDVLETPDMATGCVDAAKRRIVCSTFSSRAGSDRRLYTSTYSGASSGSSGEAEDNVHFVPISGAWKEHEAELQKPATRPLAMVVDHESIVVGCQDGAVYRVGFVGCQYNDRSAETLPADWTEQTRRTAEGADAVIDDLLELRDIWSELLLPADAGPDHPGRLPLKRDLIAAVGLN